MLISSCSSQVREEYAHAISYLIAELKATGAKRHLSFGAILIYLCIKTRSFYQDRLGTSMGIGKQHSKKRATTFCAAAGLYIEMREEYRNMFLPERSSCKDMIEYDGACAKRKEKKTTVDSFIEEGTTTRPSLFEFFPMFAPSLSWQA